MQLAFADIQREEHTKEVFEEPIISRSLVEEKGIYDSREVEKSIEVRSSLTVSETLVDLLFNRVLLTLRSRSFQSSPRNPLRRQKMWI